MERSGRLADVIGGGYCIGCGACAAAEGSVTRMMLTPTGLLQAELTADASPDAAARLARVCGFSGAGPDEDELAAPLFESGCERHPALGYYSSLYAGYVRENGFRAAGSSGGMGSWIQCELLRLGRVDHVINVASRTPDAEDGRLFAYQIASSLGEVKDGVKSKYYPVELSEVLRAVRGQPGRYALVGLPCFLKSARLLCRVDPLLAERLTCFVGLVCGHLKSTRFADLLAWQLGIEPGSLRAFDFRRKLEHLPANRYGVEATGTRDGRTSTTSAPANDLLGADWGHGFFKYKACDFCDDVFAEVADIVIGDAWLPRYSQDWQGTNVVLVRRRDLDEIVRAAAAEGRLHLEPITAEDAAHSQAAGLRHRRDGLRYRLELAGRRGEWAPPKRVEPGSRHLTRSARARFRLRERMRDRSHEEFARTLADGDLSRFTRRMLRLVAAYRRAGLSPLERLRDTAAYVARGIAVRLRRLGSGPAPLPGNE